MSDGSLSHLEHWNLFRSGQFIHHVAFDERPQLPGRVHALQILDTVTAVFEFAARMAQRNILSPEAKVTFDLCGVDGLGLSWPKDVFGGSNEVGQNCWSQDESFTETRLETPANLKARKRGLALEVALQIYSRFGWLNPPTQCLEEEQNRRFGAV